MSVIFLTLVFAASVADGPKPAAMILAITGDVKLLRNGAEPQQPKRMGLLLAGDKLTTPAAGGCRVVFLVDGHTEDVHPSQTAAIAAAGVSPADAAARATVVVPESALKGLQALAQSGRAGVEIIRSPKEGPPCVLPIHTATVPTTRPDFAWPKEDGAVGHDVAVYRGEKKSADGLVWAVECREPALAYPAGQAALTAGETYFWTVTARGPKVRIVAEAVFQLATADEAKGFADVAKLAASRDPADRLLAAALYEGAKVYGESLRLYQKLAVEFPAETWVQTALAGSLNQAGRIGEAADVIDRMIKSAPPLKR